MSIIKQYLKKKSVCKVTFKLPKQGAASARNICVVGEFNGWDAKATPMKKMKNGDYSATVHLDLAREYQFRYLKDDTQWENDLGADKFVPSPFGEDNSVIVI